MTYNEKNTHISLPIWLATLLIGVFLALVGMLFNNIDNRLNRIEMKIDSHIMSSTLPNNSVPMPANRF